MKLTTRHKKFVGVLGLCLSALLFDKMFLSPDTTSAAALEESRAAYAVDQSAETASFELPAIAYSESTFSDRLAAVRSERDLDYDVPNVLATVTVQQGVTIRSHQDAFRDDHRLTAVVIGANPSALVDGRWIVPGTIVDGFELVGIKSRSVRFEAGGRVVTLLLLGDTDN